MDCEAFCLALATFCIIMVVCFYDKIKKLEDKLIEYKITTNVKLEFLEDNVYALKDKNKKVEVKNKRFSRGAFKKGDRVRFKTMGGWYNGGIVKDVDDDSCLIEVDTLGCEQSLEYGYIQLPYYVRILLSSSILEKDPDEILCDSCGTKGCMLQTGIIRSHCDFYTKKNAESEVPDADSY